VEPAELSKVVENHVVFGGLLGLLPRNHFERKAGAKMDEKLYIIVLCMRSLYQAHIFPKLVITFVTISISFIKDELFPTVENTSNFF